VQPLTDPFDAELQHDTPGQEQEEEWQQRLCNLHEWICHLLIKNQQLRMSLLGSAADTQPKDTKEELS
jgi:hypothetical protein